MCQDLASEIALLGYATAFSTLSIAVGVVIALLIIFTLFVGLILLGVGVALKYDVDHDFKKSFGDSIVSLALNMV